jgi:hypothetical protein
MLRGRLGKEFSYAKHDFTPRTAAVAPAPSAVKAGAGGAAGAASEETTGAASPRSRGATRRKSVTSASK